MKNSTYLFLLLL